MPYPGPTWPLATQAFGQGVSATAVQVTAAYGGARQRRRPAAALHGGAVLDPDGVVLLENQPTQVRRAVSSQTAPAGPRCSRAW